MIRVMKKLFVCLSFSALAACGTSKEEPASSNPAQPTQAPKSAIPVVATTLNGIFKFEDRTCSSGTPRHPLEQVRYIYELAIDGGLLTARYRLPASTCVVTKSAGIDLVTADRIDTKGGKRTCENCKPEECSPSENKNDLSSVKYQFNGTILQLFNPSKNLCSDKDGTLSMNYRKS